MSYLIIAGQLILSLSILIVLHEMGHFFPSKWFKTRVERFYLFFHPWFSLIRGKKLDGKWQVKSPFSSKEYTNDNPDTTEYGLGWLPLGGYVKIAGMVDESFDTEMLSREPQPWEFRSKPAWQRLIIMLGGVTVNFILGFLLFGMVLWYWGEQYLPAKNVKNGIYASELGQKLGFQTGDQVVSIGKEPFVKFNDRSVIQEIVFNDAKKVTVIRNGQQQSFTVPQESVTWLTSYKNKNESIFEPRLPFVIAGVGKDTPAEKVKLQEKDTIVAINGTPTQYFDEFIPIAKANKNKAVELTIRRKGETLTVPITLTKEGQIGAFRASPAYFFELESQKYSLGQAMPLGFKYGVDFLAKQVKAFGKMFKGEIKASESLGGFGTIGSMFGSEWIWERFWRMTAILSLILGFMNLLPIPGLDGGHVIFLLFEMITGRKLSDKFVERATMIGFVLLMALVLYSNGLDIIRGIQK